MAVYRALPSRFAIGSRGFFRGETLNRDTEVLVFDE